MFGALTLTPNAYRGNISSKKTSFGRVAIGIAKGTAMLVVGVPVVTVAAGLGASAIVAYSLASPFVYGGKKLVRKIQRRPAKRKPHRSENGLADDNVLTLDPIADAVFEDDEKVFVCYVPTRQSSFTSDFDSSKQRLSQSSTKNNLKGDKQSISSEDTAPLPPPFRRMVSREKSVLLPPPVIDDVENADLWLELESVMESMEPDRISLPDNFVATDIPLNFDCEQDILHLAERMQLSQLAGPETLSLPDLHEIVANDDKCITNNVDAISSVKKQNCEFSAKKHFFTRQTTYKRMLSNLSNGSVTLYVD